MRWIARFWPWAMAMLSGLMLALSLPPAGQSWMAWIALAPLAHALWSAGERRDRRAHVRCLLLGFLAGWVYFSITFHWITTVSTIGWIALMPYLALFPALWGWFIGIVANPAGRATRDGKPAILSSRHNLWIAIQGALAWAALEWLRGWLFTGFGWNGLGVALHDNPVFTQIAAITGVGGLSFLLAETSLIAVLTVRRFRLEIGRVVFRPHYDFNLSMALVVAVFSFGVHRLGQPVETRPLRIAAVQPNIPQSQKWNPAFEDEILGRFALLTGAAMASAPDLILWPEAATPQGMFGDRKNNRFVMDLAERSDAALLLGTLDFDNTGDYNAAALLSPGGTSIQIYHKLHLVPFGEFIPFRHSFPLFAWVAGDLVPGDFSSGEKPVVFQLDNPPVRLAPLICFEDTLGRLVRKFVLAGANALVNVTNDGWFLESPAARQHLANAVFRCPESGLPMIRCANTGVTCVVDRFGRVIQKLEDEHGSIFIEGTLFGVVDVPVNPPLTFYSRHGDLFSFAACGLTLVLALYSVVRGRKNPGATARATVAGFTEPGPGSLSPAAAKPGTSDQAH